MASYVHVARIFTTFHKDSKGHPIYMYYIHKCIMHTSYRIVRNFGKH